MCKETGAQKKRKEHTQCAMKKSKILVLGHLVKKHLCVGRGMCGGSPASWAVLPWKTHSAGQSKRADPEEIEMMGHSLS